MVTRRKLVYIFRPFACETMVNYGFDQSKLALKKGRDDFNFKNNAKPCMLHRNPTMPALVQNEVGALVKEFRAS